MNEINDLLSELKQEYQAGTPSSAPLADLLQEVQAEVEQPRVNPQETPAPNPQPAPDLAAARDERRQLAQEEKARQWLRRLNPKSEEGIWFEEFSYSYESRLQAAVDYLQALRDAGVR